MLSEILTHEDCAKCKICCCFDSSDMWEAPVMTQELKDRVLALKPETKFIEKYGKCILDMPKDSDNDDLYYCNALDKSCGCLLAEEKPFECSIWPLRVMNFNGERVIALSPVCPVVMSRPVDKVKGLAQKLAPQIFAYADKNPDIVKDYEAGYVILEVREKI